MAGSPPVRQRASTACGACRKRRTKCTRENGQSDCAQCRERGTECIVPTDDLRKRKKSAAYVRSLQSRISTLEASLSQSQRVTASPDVANRPLTAQGPRSSNFMDSFRPSSAGASGNDLSSINQAIVQQGVECFSDANDTGDVTFDSGHGTATCFPTLDRRTGSAERVADISAILRPETPHLPSLYGLTASQDFDRSLLASGGGDAETSNLDDQWALSFVRRLAPDYRQILLDSYWDEFNSIIPLVNKQVFQEAQRKQNRQFYSPFLHLCMLAAGQSSSGLTKLSSHETPFATRYGATSPQDLSMQCSLLTKHQLCAPATVAAVQAFLLLAVLDMHRRRDRSSRLLIGIACRLCLELQATAVQNDHVAAAQMLRSISNLTDVCLIYEIFWAQMLRRPTLLKPGQVKQARERSQHVRQKTNSRPVSPDAHAILVEITDLVHEFFSSLDKDVDQIDNLGRFFELSFVLSSTHKKLVDHHSCWPAALQISPSSASSSDASVLFLHIYYENAIICLHDYWMSHASIVSHSHTQVRNAYDQAAEACRTTCLENAKSILQLLKLWLEQSCRDNLPFMLLAYAHNARSYIAATVAQGPASMNEPETLSILRQLDDLLASHAEGVHQPPLPSRSPEAVSGRTIASSSKQRTLSGVVHEETRFRNYSTVGLPQDDGGLSGLPPASSSTRQHSMLRQQPPSNRTLRPVTKQPKSHLQSLGGPSLFNQSDPNYDPFFLPQERQLLGLPSNSPIGSDNIGQVARSI